MKKTGLLLSIILFSLHLCAATASKTQGNPIATNPTPSCQTVKNELDFINKMKISINQERSIIVKQLTKRERDLELLMKQLTEITPIISKIKYQIDQSRTPNYLKEINETKRLLNSQVTPIQNDLKLLLNKVKKTTVLINKLKNKTLLPKHYTATAQAFQVENLILLSEINSIQSLHKHLASELKTKTTTLHSMSQKIQNIRQEKWALLKNYQTILTKEIVLSRRTVQILEQATHTTYTTYLELNMKSIQLNNMINKIKCPQEAINITKEPPKPNTKKSSNITNH